MRLASRSSPKKSAVLLYRRPGSRAGSTDVVKDS
jgi:hypothetical protein